jgi:hypothetical protein
VKPPLKHSLTPQPLAESTNQIASGKTLQVALFTISIFVCIFCGVEGGYQLHLSHDHSALSCLQLGTPATAGEQFDPAVYQTDPPPCKAPDELGQPWRLKLVLLDMLGFVVFGTLCAYNGKHVMFASPAGN